MTKMYYCMDCKGVHTNPNQCIFCRSEKVKLLKKGTSVNVKGTKQKGKVFKMRDEEVQLIVINEAKEKKIKAYKVEQLKKVL